MLESSEGSKIDVKVEGVCVSDFSVQDKTLTFVVSFNDGISKDIVRIIPFSSLGHAARIVLKDLVELVNNINLKFDGSDLTVVTSCRIVDYDFCYTSLKVFFSNVRAKFTRVLNSENSEGYMKLVADLLGSSVRV